MSVTPIASLDEIISKAEKHARACNIQHAAEPAVNGLEKFPDSPEMLTAARAIFIEMAGMIQETHEAHQSALRIKPDSPFALQHFARFLTRQGRWNHSILPLNSPIETAGQLEECKEILDITDMSHEITDSAVQCSID